MKNIQIKARKVWAILERVLLVGVGSAAVYVSLFNHTQSIRLTALGLGALCILAGLTPMFLAYTKNVWNEK